MTTPETHTRLLKAEALRLGFSACGVSPAEPVGAADRDAFVRWIDEDCHADMGYLAANLDKRLDPTLLVEGARSVVSVALNYFPPRDIPPGEYRLAWYALGEDYHTVMKDKLARLLDYLRTLLPGVSGRAFCDTAPLLERYWAWRAGLGWIGKNNCLILPTVIDHQGRTIVNLPPEKYFDAAVEYETEICRGEYPYGQVIYRSTTDIDLWFNGQTLDRYFLEGALGWDKDPEGEISMLGYQNIDLGSSFLFCQNENHAARF